MNKHIAWIYLWSVLTVVFFIVALSWTFTLIVLPMTSFERISTLVGALIYTFLTLRTRHWAAEEFRKYAWDECPKLVDAAQESDIT